MASVFVELWLTRWTQQLDVITDAVTVVLCIMARASTAVTKSYEKKEVEADE